MCRKKYINLIDILRDLIIAMPFKLIKETSIRQQLIAREEATLSSHATLNKNSRGRRKTEQDEDVDIRTPFQRDRDRITHAKTFRRLKHKTQVFLAPTGDHYRTRLTHVLEVSQIARTISSVLCLNEPLTEAIALGHDLGHTPFGHAGEVTLNQLHPGGFKHYIHSLRVVDHLENNGKGLNLTYEVRNGIVHHSKGNGEILPKDKGKLAFTLEGQIVRVADIIAYVNHDLDDALRAGILKEADLPQKIKDIVGDRHSQRIGTMVKDLIVETLAADDGQLHVSDQVLEAMTDLRTFLFNSVYRYYQVHDEFIKAQHIIRNLYNYFLDNGLVRRGNNERKADKNFQQGWPDDDTAHRKVCDFIAGMTDRYALDLYEQIFLPKPWNTKSFT